MITVNRPGLGKLWADAMEARVDTSGTYIWADDLALYEAVARERGMSPKESRQLAQDYIRTVETDIRCGNSLN